MDKDCKFSSCGTLGPSVSLRELQQMIKSGQLLDDDTIYVPALGVWQPLHACRGAVLRLTPAPAARPQADSAASDQASTYDLAPVDDVVGLSALQNAQTAEIKTRADRSEWFYTRDGQQLGPISARQLKSLARAGTLTAEDQVWRQGMPD